MSFKKMRAACLLGGVFVFASLSAQAEVFINEIHYDDADTPTSGDTNESLEIVATAGEDLTLYDIVLYNGSAPAAAVTYDTDAIPAGSNVACGSNVRIAVLAYPVNGIQNGANDAIAIVRRSDSVVVQFISYEGAATATNGPASGMTSVNIPVSETNSTAEGTSLQLTGTGSANANFTWAASATSTFGTCNNSQTFNLGPPVNVLPSVSSTTPVNASSVLPGTSNFSVTFSESVNALATAFTMSCSLSGTVALSFPASGTSFAITGTPALQNGDSCVLTIYADQITDAGGANPAVNTVVNFTVSPPPNAAPYVVSTTPEHNAIGVPTATEFRVVFSEMVKADSETFALQCTISGLVPNLLQYKVLEMVDGAGRAITLSSPTLFQPGETCTLTVIAQGVIDSAGLAMTQDKVVSFKIAGGSVATYYNRVNTSSAEQLRCSLNTVIRGHTVYPYSASTTDTWDILEIADEDPSNANNILDVYKNRSFIKVSDRAGTGSGVTYNREHTWPNSLGFGSTTGNLGLPHGPYTDTHMLYLSDTNYNADRSNSPYSYCTMAAGCAERATEINNGSGGGTGVYPGNSNWYNANAFETWSKRQGDVARAVMYMAIRYEGGTHTVTGQNEPDLELTDNAGLIIGTANSPAYMGLLTDLLLWHQADPPDAAEVARNEVIYNFQGNRNPFIDHPEWGTQALFTSAKPASCTLNTNSSNPIKRYRAMPTPKPPRQSIRN